jgi:hypothetical protein
LPGIGSQKPGVVVFGIEKVNCRGAKLKPVCSVVRISSISTGMSGMAMSPPESRAQPSAAAPDSATNACGIAPKLRVRGEGPSPPF